MGQRLHTIEPVGLYFIGSFSSSDQYYRIPDTSMIQEAEEYEFRIGGGWGGEGQAMNT